MRHLDYLAARITVATAPDPTAPASPTTPAGGGSGLRDQNGNLIKQQAPSWLNSQIVIGTLLFVVMLLLAWLGIKMMAKSEKGDVKKAANQSAVAAIGLFWVVVAFGGLALVIIGGLAYAFINVG